MKYYHLIPRYTMKIFIITENWQYSDKRVTKVVNDYANAVSERYDLEVFHIIKVYSFKMKLFRKLFYLPLSLYNGMLPIDIYKNSSYTSDKFSFTKIKGDNFNIKKIGISEKDKIIIHWLHTALIVLSSLTYESINKYDITVVVHELQPQKWLSKENNLKVLMNVRVLSRNTKISSYLLDYGINSKVIRSFI